MLTVDNNAQFH